MMPIFLLAGLAHALSPMPPSAGHTDAGGLHGTLESRSGATITGTVRMTAAAPGPDAAHGAHAAPTVHVVLHVEGATPGDHAVHVHEKGDCSAPDATSAGSHFNPAGAPHGNHDSAQKHPGDFGNLHVGADGKGEMTLEVSSITLDGGPVGVLGRSVIVHEKIDDFGQPTGNAGARQACAVLRAAK